MESQKDTYGILKQKHAEALEACRALEQALKDHIRGQINYTAAALKMDVGITSVSNYMCGYKPQSLLWVFKSAGKMLEAV